MERLTIEKAGSILVKDLSGGYTSPCFGCESIGNCVSKKIQPCAIYRALEKLKNYEDLEERGKLHIFPCAIGDTVYQINKRAEQPIIPLQVINFKAFNNNLVESFKMECVDKWGGGYSYRKKDIERDVFLTREEAEAALQKMKETEVG